MSKDYHNKLLHDIYKRASKIDDSLSKFTYNELRLQLKHYRIKYKLTKDKEYLDKSVDVDIEMTNRLINSTNKKNEKDT